MAQFHLIRHGQASFGAANYDKLSQLGHQQARWLGEYYRVRGETFDALVTGDLVRHVETGEGIQEGLGSSLAADLQPGLNEFDFHSIVDAYLSAHPEEVPPEGASMAAFYRVLVVSSGGAIAMWMRHMLNTADDTVVELNLQIRNTGVTQGFFNKNVYRLSIFNQVPHLDREDRGDAITYS